MYDYKVSPVNAPAIIDSSLSPGYYSYKIPGGAALQVVNFTSMPGGGMMQSSSWDFGDGISSASANPSHTYSKPGYYTVCHNVNYMGSCMSNLCSEIRIGVPDTACSADFSYSSMGMNVSFTSSVNTGTAPYTYFWDLGDGNTSAAPSFSHNYSSSGMYNVCLKVTDANGFVVNVCKNISTQGFMGCMTNFSYTSGGTVPNTLSLSNIAVTWTDASGTVYTSDNIAQPGDSYFRIISAENYLDNENNQTTKKLRVQFKCRVYNGSNYLQIDNAEAEICIAYK